MIQTNQQPGSENNEWQHILAVTEHILDCAKNDDWDELPELARQRDGLIRNYFAKPVNVNNALRIHDEIRHLLAIDEQVLGLARKNQADLGVILKQLQSGGKATQAYEENISL